jgi:hypothetical protein
MGSSGSSGVFSTPDAAPKDDGCSEASKLVYVVSAENDLYSFKPDKKQFTKIGTLNCNAGGANPNSMAVDRSGTAWVNFSDGGLFKVSTTDASCTSTTFQKGQRSWGRFGMAFSSNSAGSKDETLYVVGIGDVGAGLGMGTIDLTSLKLNYIGDFTGSLRAKGAELTGTGDGKLFGFFTTMPANLAEINKASAATPSPQSLTTVNTGLAWAFSFWGGDFWMYTADGFSTSQVTQVKASTDKSVAVVMEDIGFTIVGAGVSTCAPTSIPK